MSDAKSISTCGPIDGSIRPPGSKSITNRALICAALASGKSTLIGALASEDTQVMVRALGSLGITIATADEGRRIEIEGCRGEIEVDRVRLDLANSGTSIRFLTALATLVHGHVTLDGVERMRQRPIGDLNRALNGMGASVTSLNGNDCPPVEVVGTGLTGGSVSVRGDISSQFLSALLMVSPYATSSTVIDVEGLLVSLPYVQMTIDVMDAFGVDCDSNDAVSQFSIAGSGVYRAREYDIEPDASAASYFWAAAAITGGDVTVGGIPEDSLQGDVRFCECLRAMGCRVESNGSDRRVLGGPLSGIDVDMNDISDTVQTLAAVALFAEGSTRIRGVAHNRHKETDRIADLATELRRLGATVDEFDDGLEITPGPLTGCDIHTYRDHRMAMSLALVGLRVPGVRILDPGCTAKTYPRYFEDLEGLTGV